MNAHTRRNPKEDDIVFFAKENISGRLEKCIRIGECINGRYWLKQSLFDLWGGFEFPHKKVTKLYLQRSGALPQFKDARKFYKWFIEQLADQQICLVQRNN